MAHARVLGRLPVNDPRLPLDEPLGKLDSLTRMTLQGELLKIWQTSRFTSLLVAHDVEEALLLTQRIIIFSDRPARVVRELDVPLAYPRHRDATLVALRRAISASKAPKPIKLQTFEHTTYSERSLNQIEYAALKILMNKIKPHPIRVLLEIIQYIQSLNPMKSHYWLYHPDYKRILFSFSTYP